MQQNLPKHVAVIPDGNRRWAESHGFYATKGHHEGRNRFREISQAAFDLDIPYFTFWAMSEDNLKKRGVTEINFLVALLKEELHSHTMDKIIRNQVRFRVLGNWRNLIHDGILAKLIDKFENETRHFDKHHLTILLGYDGTIELEEDIQKNLATWIQWEPKPSFEMIRQASWAGILTPVDLEIRTGETMENWFHNSSGFMMLHTANSEIRLSQTLWPNFSVDEFKKIVAEYGQREKRLGK